MFFLEFSGLRSLLRKFYPFSPYFPVVCDFSFPKEAQSRTFQEWLGRSLPTSVLQRRQMSPIPAVLTSGNLPFPLTNPMVYMCAWPSGECLSSKERNPVLGYFERTLVTFSKIPQGSIGKAEPLLMIFLCPLK